MDVLCTYRMDIAYTPLHSRRCPSLPNLSTLSYFCHAQLLSIPGDFFEFELVFRRIVRQHHEKKHSHDKVWKERRAYCRAFAVAMVVLAFYSHPSRCCFPPSISNRSHIKLTESF